MKIPQNSIELAMTFEGFSPIPYLCPAGFWTIGFGHLCSKDHLVITKEQGLIYLKQDMVDALIGTLRYCPNLINYEKRLGAITDFTFNLGVGRLQNSTLRRRINQENWEEVKKELMRWVNGGGRKLPGLVARRQAECAFI